MKYLLVFAVFSSLSGCGTIGGPGDPFYVDPKPKWVKVGEL